MSYKGNILLSSLQRLSTELNWWTRLKLFGGQFGICLMHRFCIFKHFTCQWTYCIVIKYIGIHRQWDKRNRTQRRGMARHCTLHKYLVPLDSCRWKSRLLRSCPLNALCGSIIFDENGHVQDFRLAQYVYIILYIIYTYACVCVRVLILYIYIYYIVYVKKYTCILVVRNVFNVERAWMDIETYRACIPCVRHKHKTS